MSCKVCLCYAGPLHGQFVANVGSYLVNEEIEAVNVATNSQPPASGPRRIWKTLYRLYRHYLQNDLAVELYVLDRWKSPFGNVTPGEVELQALYGPNWMESGYFIDERRSDGVGGNC